MSLPNILWTLILLGALYNLFYIGRKIYLFNRTKDK